MQAQTLQRRFREAEKIWSAIDALTDQHGLPERVGDPLFEAVLGYQVRRPGYVKRAAIDERTATRDLSQLVAVGLLDAVGQTRGRHYVASDQLRRLVSDSRSGRTPLVDPYPWLTARLRA